MVGEADGVTSEGLVLEGLEDSFSEEVLNASAVDVVGPGEESSLGVSSEEGIHNLLYKSARRRRES